MSEELNRNFSLVKFEGKAFEKLVDTLSSAVGFFFKKKGIKNDADGNAYRIVKLAEAETQAAMIRTKGQSEIDNQTKYRLYIKEKKRTQNINEVVFKAAGRLSENVSDAPVDIDWVDRFLNIAQDVSSNELQEIWAKILAGEISEPGSIAIRTLNVVSNLSRKEAEIFSRVSSLSNPHGTIIKTQNLNLEKYDITYEDILSLREAGLLSESNSIVVQYKLGNDKRPDGKRCNYIVYGNYLLMYDKDGSDKVEFEQFAMTKAGVELLSILNPKPDMVYIQDILNMMVANGFSAQIIELVVK